jgi:hypothetical protein
MKFTPVHVVTQHRPVPVGRPPEIEAHIGNAIAEALTKHGPAALTSTRAMACAHEAGHAICGAALGVPIIEVKIFANGTEWSGLTKTSELWFITSGTTADADLKFARFCYAGAAGETVAGLWRPGSSLDEIIDSQFAAQVIGQKLKLKDPERLWYERIEKPVRDTIKRNRAPFNRLVELLDRRGRVYGNWLREILQRVPRLET